MTDTIRFSRYVDLELVINICIYQHTYQISAIEYA